MCKCANVQMLMCECANMQMRLKDQALFICTLAHLHNLHTTFAHLHIYQFANLKRGGRENSSQVIDLSEVVVEVIEEHGEDEAGGFSFSEIGQRISFR